MKEKVLETINKYQLIESGDKIVIGVSGGPDSMCLLDILLAIKQDKDIALDYEIYVAHMDHKIREESKQDAIYVKTYCNKHEISCYIKQEDVKKIADKEKIGLEEAGRQVRYDFFEEVKQQVGANKIAIAHNLNDKIETILMNIVRGSGPLGLKGIEPIRQNTYIRPLIEIEKQEIEDYCKKQNLNPRIDKTNLDNTYTRNKIRNQLIPYLKQEFNPNLLEAINRLSQITTDEQNYLEKMVHTIYDQLCIQEKEKEIVLDLKQFNNIDKVLKRKLLLYTINKLLGTSQNIGKIHIEDVITLCANNVGNKYLLPNKHIKIFVKKGKVFFLSQE